MKKKLTALFLVLTMAISMISCGNAKNEENKVEEVADVTALFQNFADMQARTTEATGDVELSGKWIEESKMDKIKFSFMMSSIIQDDNKVQGELSYKLGDATEFKKLTTVILDNKAIYVDFETLQTAAIDICNVLKISDAAAVLSVLPPAKYIKLDEQTFKTLLEQSGQKDVTMPAFDMTQQKENQKIVTAASEFVLKMVQDAVKDVQPEVISGTSKSIKLNITKENISGVCDAILALDLDAKYDELVQKMNEAGNAEEYTKPLVKEKSNVLKGIKEALPELKNEKDNFNAINISTDVSVEGEKGDRKVTEKVAFHIEDNENKAAISFDAVVGEKLAEDKTVTIPTDTTDLLTYMYQLTAAMQF